ncbi:MAG TPA: restriction endonuclease subunit S [Cellvibrio sp.]|nr:restriction endonuclease subunit S [Cellvibrio sp.]
MSKSIPSDWRVDTLEKFTNSITVGHVGSTSEFYRNEGILFLRTGNLNSGKIVLSDLKFITQEFHESLGKSKLREGDVLVSRVGYTGNAAIVPKGFPEANCANIIIIRADETVHPEYLHSFINSPVAAQQNAAFSVGSAQAVLNTGAIKKLIAVIPPLPEQQKISAILTSVDEVIESTQAQINKLKDLKTGMMQELLTKGIDHSEFKDSPVGRIPKAWQFKAIGDICKITSGGTPDRATASFWNGDIPWIKTGEINYKTIYSAEEYITQDGLKNSSTKLIPAGSVLMAMYGQGITRGKVAILGIDACLNQACLAMLPSVLIDQYFLFYFFSNEYENLRLLVQEGTQKNLNASIVKDVIVPLPSIAEQMEISKRLQSIDNNINRIQKKVDVTTQLKKALMQDLLTGKVRVKVN